MSITLYTVQYKTSEVEISRDNPDEYNKKVDARKLNNENWNTVKVSRKAVQCRLEQR